MADSENDVYELGGLFDEVDAEEDHIADASSDEDHWQEEQQLESFEHAWFNNPEKKEEEKKEEVKKETPAAEDPKKSKKKTDNAKKPEDEEKIVNELMMMGFP